MIFWILLFCFVSLTTNKIEFKLNFDNPAVLMFWFASLYTIVARAIGANTPIGALKYRKRYFKKTEEPVSEIEISAEMKEHNKGAWKILALWCAFLFAEWLAIPFIDEYLIILGMILLRAFEKFFIITKCPFGIIMKNTCCTKCRIYGWDQFMLNSPLLFYSNVVSLSLVLPSIILFVSWELSVQFQKERFCKSNFSIDCTNCDQFCGRCNHLNEKP